MLRKILSVIIVVIVIATVCIIPCAALGSIDDVMGNAQSISLAQLYTPCYSITQTIDNGDHQVYDIPLSDSVILDTADNMFSYNSYSVTLDPGVYSNGDDSSVFSVTQDINVTYAASSNTLVYSLPANTLVFGSNNGATFRNAFHFLKRSDVRYIRRSDLSAFLVQPSYISLIGSYSYTELHNVQVSYIQRVLGDEPQQYHYQIVTDTVQGNSKSDLLTSLNYVIQRDDILPIIGISNYYINFDGNVMLNTSGAAQIFNGRINLPLRVNGTSFSNQEFLAQTPYGNVIGKSDVTTEVIYNNNLDIAAVFNSVKNALDIPMFGDEQFGISFLDILTLIVGISIAVWLLKVFAGG